ncbi:MAG: EamA family transporter [Hyphomicrobiales bacterium]|nr:EamA family transporter [Hyphomicrobiales bacterium]MDE2114635.1 EamA family transporter [Hyphomicrobiales bacterium]
MSFTDQKAAAMSPRHLALAMFVMVIWGFNFVVTRLALDHYPPMLLVAMRFALAAVPALFLPRPRIGFWRMVGISASMFMGQYVFLYLALMLGFPAGLSSVALQVQAFFTILLAAAVLGERPSPRQIIGTLVAFAGLAVIGLAVSGAGIPLASVILLLASGLAWAVGNVLMRGGGSFDPLAMIVWLSLIPPLPVFLLSLYFEGTGRVMQALAATNWQSLALLAYIAVFSTLVGFGIWGYLLKTYPASTIAPLTLLVPITGAASAALVLGEHFGTYRIIGMVLILAGLAIVALPARFLPRMMLRRGA